MPDVKICDVTLRDGLQVLDHRARLSLDTRLQLLAALQRANLPYLEVGSFVNPRVVPAMKDTAALLDAVAPSACEVAVLVPNVRYYELLRQAPRVDTVALFISASERYSYVNTRMTLAEATDAARAVATRARADGYRLRAYLSCAFRDLADTDRPMAVETVLAPTRALLEMGCQAVALSDTSGTARGGDIERIVGGVAEAVGLERIAVHLHDRYGVGITNAYIAYRAGVRIFDCSVGGIGGNKAVANSVGNVATEELVYLFESLDVDTGVDREALFEAARLVYQIAERLGGPMPASKIVLHQIARPPAATAAAG